MSYVYKPFPLDKWVSRLFKVLGVINPDDIDERVIARKLGIHLKYSEKRNYSFEQGNFKIININIDQDKVMQREVFYHELCHLLRHSGNQWSMPLTWRELQEWDCEHFTRYAAVPFHMLKEVDWQSPTLVSDMSSLFKISEEICQYRVEHIRRNMKGKIS
ncbi:ImmA/IrrE family metallo-endopeptidase [Bacillus sp. Bva_UNVM-123]